MGYSADDVFVEMKRRVDSGSIVSYDVTQLGYWLIKYPNGRKVMQAHVAGMYLEVVSEELAEDFLR